MKVYRHQCLSSSTWTKWVIFMFDRWIGSIYFDRISFPRLLGLFV